MTIGSHLREAGRAECRVAAALAVAAALLAGGCSFERTFCGSDSLSCEARADYVWEADVR